MPVRQISSRVSAALTQRTRWRSLVRPIELEIAGADKAVPSTKLIQHTWNRLIEDFVRAVRNDDKDHQRYRAIPPLPTAYAPKKSSMPPAGRATLGTGRQWANERSVRGWAYASPV